MKHLAFLSAVLISITTLRGAGAVAPAAPTVTVAQIKADPELWPAQVKVKEALNYGAVKIPANLEVDFVDFNKDQIRFQYRQQMFLLEPEMTDLVARAGRIASGQAAAQGWRGRVADYLLRRGQQVGAAGVGPMSADGITAETLFVVYYGSSDCVYCASALPFMNHTLDLLEQRYPGKFRRVFSAGESDSPAGRDYIRKLGAGWIAAPLGERNLWSGLPDLIPAAATAVNYPAVALVTAKGRFIAAGMRQSTGTKDVDAVLRKLDETLASGAGGRGGLNRHLLLD